MHSLAVYRARIAICAYCKYFPLLFLPQEGDGIFDIPQVMSTRKISVKEAAGIMSESMYTVPSNYRRFLFIYFQIVVKIEQASHSLL